MTDVMSTVKSMLLAAWLLASGAVMGQGEVAPPQAEFVFEIRALLAPTEVQGESKDGMRQVIPITGGTVIGPDVNAEIVPGGADYQLVRPDGVRELEAVYMIRTDDGVLINVVNAGIIVDPTAEEPGYIMTTPSFQAPVGKYDWLNKAIFLSKITGGSDSPRAVHISVYIAR